MMVIPLTQGQNALVDDEDTDLASVKWCAVKYKSGGKTFYATRSVRNELGQFRVQLLHRVIASRMGIAGKVDHKDRNGLNCTRNNLRAANPSQSGANRGIFKNNTSGIKGVSWHKRIGKWEARVTINREKHNIGYFADLQVAKRAVEAAREKAFGEFTCHS